MKKTILIVDDFENTLFVTGLTLQNNGYNVLKASSGTEALNYFDGTKIDLVITDFNMPQMNGLQLVEKIRQNPMYLRVPIFVLSTETAQDVKTKAYESGVTAWIKKPFKIEEILKLVARAIN